MNSPATGFVQNDDAMTRDELELARLIVSTLDLDLKAEDVDPVAPLYGEGLGLDSIDILEITLSISKVFGIKLRSDDETSRRVFSSLRSLSLHIQQNRVK
jgi:acyl carrier protein